MFKINKKKKEIEEETIDKPKFYKEMITNIDNRKLLNTYWCANYGQIPNFNSWGELYKFLKDEAIYLSAKLEVIDNLDCHIKIEGSIEERDPARENIYYDPLIDKRKTIQEESSEKSNAGMPDYFWADKTLNRKVRAFSRIKSKDYYKKCEATLTDIKKQELLVENIDEELFLGLCELLETPLYHLFNSDKITLEQKELIVKSAINFEQSFNRQQSFRFYTLLVALEQPYFSTELKDSIYNVIKDHIHCYIQSDIMSKKIFPTFLNRFYKDENIPKVFNRIEELCPSTPSTIMFKSSKLQILTKTLPVRKQDDNYREQYLFYLGNKNIPSWIQEIVLEHFVNATGYNLEHSHPQTYRNLNASNFVNILLNSELPLDLKVRLINGVTNPMLLCYAILEEEVDDTLAELLKTKLETLKISETKEVLEIIKTLISNPELCGKRLIKKQEK